MNIKDVTIGFTSVLMFPLGLVASSLVTVLIAIALILVMPIIALVLANAVTVMMAQLFNNWAILGSPDDIDDASFVMEPHYMSKRHPHKKSEEEGEI